MEINIENAKAALNTADESVKKVLLALLPELKDIEAQKAANRPITERVKTFEDACRELGEDHPFVQQWHNVYKCTEDESTHDLYAYMKLRIITAALNEGWQPEFTEDEWRWYPYHYLYTEEELSEKDEAWKEKRVLMSTGDYVSSYAGFVWADSTNAPSYAGTYFGSRLCLKSEALATYCGTQFISLWADFFLTRKEADHE